MSIPRRLAAATVISLLLFPGSALTASAVQAASTGIAGVITTSSGRPIENACITVMTQAWDPPAATATTGRSGRYQIRGIAPGSYLINFTDCEGSRFVDEWYSDVRDFELASRVEVTAGQTTRGVDAALARPSHLTGRAVEEGGSPIAGLCLGAYDLSEFDRSGEPILGVTDAQGYFDISLRASTYKLFFANNMCERDLYVDEWHQGAFSKESATELLVPEEASVDVGTNSLRVGGIAAGRLTREWAGTPASNICVFVSNIDEPSDGSDGYAYSDEHGNFAIIGLRTGRYTARFDDCNWPRRFVSEWYSNKAMPETADRFDVIERELTFIEEALAGGQIDGRVAHDGGGAAPGVCAEVHDSEFNVIRSVVTGVDGSFSLAALSDGDYRLHLRDCSFEREYASEWFRDAYTFAEAEVVTVSEGQAHFVEASVAATITPRPSPGPSPLPSPPSPSPSPSPSPTEAPSPSPSPDQSPWQSPSPTHSSTPEPSPSASPAPLPSPLFSPDPVVSPSPSPTPQPSPEPSPSPWVEPSPQPSPSSTPEPSPVFTPDPTSSPWPSPTPSPEPEPDPERDSDPPETTLLSHPKLIDNSATPSFQFEADEESTFVCWIDDSPGQPCDSGVSFEGLSDGPHRFEVFAVDRSNNIDTTPARWEWTIDTVDPEVMITSSPTGWTSSAEATIEFSSDEQAEFSCRTDDLEPEPCTSPVSLDQLGEGDHTFEVVGRDLAGNTSVPAISTWRVDSTAPEVSVAAPWGTYLYGHHIPIGDDAYVAGWMIVEARASDPSSGIAQLWFTVDGTRVPDEQVSTDGARWWFKYRPAAVGRHAIEATAVNGAGIVAAGQTSVFSFSEASSSQL